MAIKRSSLPLSALRAFESAAIHLHLGKAGAQLGVTHGAISHQVKALEQYLGIDLFIRKGNRLHLTPAGRYLQLTITNSLDSIMDGILNLSPDTLSGTLHVACTQTLATSWAIKHICEFQKSYPDIELEVSEIEPKQKIIPNEIDVAICYGKPELQHKIATSLVTPSVFPVCNPRLLQNQSSKLKAEDVLNFTLLYDHLPSWDHWLKHYKVTELAKRKTIRFANTAQALTAASLGYGIALCNTLETDELIQQGQLVRFLHKPILEENSYFLVTQAREKQSLKAQLFSDWITKICEN